MTHAREFAPLDGVVVPSRVARAWLAALQRLDAERPEGWHLEDGVAQAAGATLDQSWNVLCAGVADGSVQVTLEAPPARCWVRVTPARERRA